MTRDLQSNTVKVTVPGGDRLDRALRALPLRENAWLSRGAWRKLFEIAGVKGERGDVRKPGETLSSDTVIHLSFPGAFLPTHDHTQIASAKDVYLEPGAAWGAFLKPEGVPTYPLFPWEAGTFVENVAAFLARAGHANPEAFYSLGPPPALEGGLAQRLDNGTSGIILAGWTEKAKADLRALFDEHRVQKSYLALVRGDFGGEFANREFLLFPVKASRMVALDTHSGAASSSRFAEEGREVHCTVDELARAGDYALVRFSTFEGVRHQVRAVLASLGAPLVGDTLYGGEESPLGHHLLHAYSVRLPEGFGRLSTIVAAPTAAFVGEANRLGIYWDGETPT